MVVSRNRSRLVLLGLALLLRLYILNCICRDYVKKNTTNRLTQTCREIQSKSEQLTLWNVFELPLKKVHKRSKRTLLKSVVSEISNQECTLFFSIGQKTARLPEQSNYRKCLATGANTSHLNFVSCLPTVEQWVSGAEDAVAEVVSWLLFDVTTRMWRDKNKTIEVAILNMRLATQ